MGSKLNPTEILSDGVAPNRRSFVKYLIGAGAVLAGLSVVPLKTIALASRKELQPFSGAGLETGVGNADPANPQVPYIYWTWPSEITRGDCTISPGATFQLFADGSTRWICNIRSSDSGDEWDGRFEIKNRDGQVVGSTPGYHYDIHDANVTKPWNEFRGPNQSLASAYPQANMISFYCSC